MKAPFRVVCINDGPIPSARGGISLNGLDRVVNGKIYTVEKEVISEAGNRCYILAGINRPKQVIRFIPIDEQRERIKYVAVSETLREKAVEVAAIETN